MVFALSLQLCRPCLTHTTSRQWTRTSRRESSLPPSLSDLVLTDLLGVSIAVSPCSHQALTFLGWPPSAVSVSDVCGLFMEYKSSITASQFSLCWCFLSSFQTHCSAEPNEQTHNTLIFSFFLSVFLFPLILVLQIYFLFLQTAAVHPAQYPALDRPPQLQLTLPHASASVIRSPSPLRAAKKLTPPKTFPLSP